MARSARMGAVAASELWRGRQAYAECAWSQAYELLSRGDQEQSLSAPDLELLARAAYMLGRDQEYASSLERAFHAYLDAGDVAANAAASARGPRFQPLSCSSPLSALSLQQNVPRAS